METTAMMHDMVTMTTMMDEGTWNMTNQTMMMLSNMTYGVVTEMMAGEAAVTEVTIDVGALAGDFKVVLPCVFGALLVLALTMVVFYHNVGEIEEIILEKEEEEEEHDKGGNRESWYDNRGYITTNTTGEHSQESIYTYA